MANSIIEVEQGDITKLDVDAIVNAANCSLLGGGTIRKDRKSVPG